MKNDWMVSRKLHLQTLYSLLTFFRVAFVFSLQGWLAESPEQKKTAATPAYMSVLMSCKSPPFPLLQELSRLDDSVTHTWLDSNGAGCGTFP